ncbi:MAG TPA: peptidoglycan DD-metalloendopeptidase family protein [Nevskia sp.]|nr:peptidoglycan DD-metalloendopeptidase family protein [Nevskia sp.]
MQPRLALMVTLAVLAAGCGSSSVHEQAARRSRNTATAPARAAAAPGQYVVQRGDTLYSIAFRHQLDYHDLADWNGIGRGYAIYPGRVLRLTPPGSPVLPPPEREAAAPIPLGPPPRTGSPPPATAASAAPPRPATPPPTVPSLPPDSAPRSAIPSSAPVAAPADGDVSGPRFDAGRWEWPTRGKVVRGFSADGSSKGLDIAGELGQIVVAAAGGRVVYSGSALKGYGELVIIKHDEQYLSAYGYNRRRLVEEGQQVLAGQPIAELGDGPEQKPLLHFEIRDRGRPVDPLPLLPKR